MTQSSTRAPVNGWALLEQLRTFYATQAWKHGLNKPGQTVENYADEQIDAMTNTELVVAIGDALEELGKLQGT